MTTTQALFEIESIYSSLGADSDLAELVEMFVDEMPDRIASLAAAYDSDDREELGRTAHQLKGSIGSYGFGQLTPYAANLEHFVRDGGTEEQITESYNSLVTLCNKLRSGTPQ